MMGLSLLVLRCADVERCRAFYEMLGMRFARHAHGTGPEHYAHEDARGVFELYPATEANPADRVALGLRVADLPASHAAFTAAGLAPAPVRETPWGTTFILRDPDGRRVEITQGTA